MNDLYARLAFLAVLAVNGLVLGDDIDRAALAVAGLFALSMAGGVASS